VDAGSRWRAKRAKKYLCVHCASSVPSALNLPSCLMRCLFMGQDERPTLFGKQNLPVEYRQFLGLLFRFCESPVSAAVRREIGRVRCLSVLEP